MCRIAGVISATDPSLLVEEMCFTMRRGGPDDHGIFTDAERKLALGHRRLSILDLTSAGHQPMQSIDGSLVLSYNGEIYNFKELKEELQASGWEFRTNTDTEVILCAYQHWGISFLRRLNGMFALALYDRANGRLHLARDPAGIKPLYFAQQNGIFYFASELRALNSTNVFRSNEDWPYYFMLFGHLPEPITTLKGVEPLRKGTYLSYDFSNSQYEIKAFTETAAAGPVITDEQVAIQAIRSVLQQATGRHLISDAAIGLFLSGGIDSSLLTLIASTEVPEILETISVCFESEKFSEKKFQELILAATGAKHASFCVDQAAFEDHLADILQAMDSPSVDGVNTYFISHFAADSGLKAVLSGLGADELLGGYRSFERAKYVNWFRRLPHSTLNFLARHKAGRLGRIGFLCMQHPAAEYLFYRGLFSMKEVSDHFGISWEYLKGLILSLPYERNFDGLQGGDRAGYLEYNYYMAGQLLKDSDYMSMWHGLEIRVPFLDREFVRLCNSISPELKFGRGQGKYLLIQAFKDILPEPIWNRKKAGFVLPFEEWFKNMGLSARIETGAKLGAVEKLKWAQLWSLYLMKELRVDAPAA